MNRRGFLLIATGLIWLSGCKSGKPADVTTPATRPTPPSVVLKPAEPTPAFKIGGEGFALVKNWDFGADGNIKSIAELSEQFQYHDQFGTIGNGTNYGAIMLSPDEKNRLNKNQPIEDPKNPVRAMTGDALRTFLVPLNGATEVHPEKHNVGCGSFQAKWTLPSGGSNLGQDLVWETRVRYVTPPYFWFAIWTAGDAWNKGAEMDVVESFGYDNGGGATNFDGRFWHVDSVGGTNEVHYGSWGKAMAERGVKSFDATQWHVWTWLYRTDDTYSAYVDGIEIQKGKLIWRLGGKEAGKPINMSFLFDGGWGHTKVASVNKPLPAKELEGKYYDWDWSRVYLRGTAKPATQPAK